VRYFLQRLGQFAIVFVLVTFAVMVLMRLGLNQPGDPARTMLGGTVDQALIDTTTERYKLDQSLPVQYVFWLGNMVQFDMGFSVPNSKPVWDLIKDRAPTTLLLGTYAILWALIISVPLAVRQAYKRDSVFDKTASGMSFLFVSMPPIVLAPILTLVLIKENVWEVGDYVITIGGWFPRVGDKVYPWEDLGEHFSNFFVPTVVLTLGLAAIFARLLRGEMAMTLQSDFITLASAKGVSPRRVLWVHGLRNSLFSLLTSVGTQLGAIVGGAIVAETFFDLDGMGTMLITAVLAKDLFIVQSTAAILVACVVTVNLIVDLMYAVIDPRIRQMRALG
jgi:peptide/nickel transport system permease protein